MSDLCTLSFTGFLYNPTAMLFEDFLVYKCSWSNISEIDKNEINKKIYFIRFFDIHNHNYFELFINKKDFNYFKSEDLFLQPPLFHFKLEQRLNSFKIIDFKLINKSGYFDALENSETNDEFIKKSNEITSESLNFAFPNSCQIDFQENCNMEMKVISKEKHEYEITKILQNYLFADNQDLLSDYFYKLNHRNLKNIEAIKIEESIFSKQFVGLFNETGYTCTTTCSPNNEIEYLKNTEPTTYYTEDDGEDYCIYYNYFNENQFKKILLNIAFMNFPYDGIEFDIFERHLIITDVISNIKQNHKIELSYSTNNCHITPSRHENRLTGFFVKHSTLLIKYDKETKLITNQIPIIDLQFIFLLIHSKVDIVKVRELYKSFRKENMLRLFE